MSTEKGIAKKVIILCVLNIIKLYSSLDMPVSQTAICEYLNNIDIPCDRKTVGRNIQYLCEFGYPIKKIDGKGYYLSKEDMAKKKDILII